MQRIKEKKERSLGTKLFIKAERCNSLKCVMIRKPYRPGLHGKKRRVVSDYGRQLQEKQKLQIIYGLNNRQLQSLFGKTKNKEEVIKKLETRLDRVCFLLGLIASPRIARQLVSHGHILVNNKKVTTPSYSVRIGDIITIRSESKDLKLFEEIRVKLKQYEPPVWLKLDKEVLKGECVGMPQIGEMNLPADINLVGQFYSR